MHAERRFEAAQRQQRAAALSDADEPHRRRAPGVKALRLGDDALVERARQALIAGEDDGERRAGGRLLGRSPGGPRSVPATVAVRASSVISARRT